MANKRTETARMQTPALPTPDQFLATFPAEIRAFADQISAIATRTDMEVDEAAYSRWQLIGYRLRDGRRTRYFCYIAPFEDRVALGFEYGVLLSNDAGLLEGRGTQVRYVTIRQPRDIRKLELAALI